MKLLAITLISLFLIGCATPTPVVIKPEFPTPPELLMRKPSTLEQL